MRTDVRQGKVFERGEKRKEDKQGREERMRVENLTLFEILCYICPSPLNN